MSPLPMIAIDLLAIGILTFGLYFPRHHRRDLLVAYLVVNVGVLAVASVLSFSSAALGLGLGLFGVLSIIRLRSTEIDQREVAYYFSALALGLIAGVMSEPTITAVTLMSLVVLAVAVGDHPRLFRHYRQQAMTLDRAFVDEHALRAHLEGLLGASVKSVVVKKVDLVRGTTSIDVRYELSRIGSTTGPSIPELERTAS